MNNNISAFCANLGVNSSNAGYVSTLETDYLEKMPCQIERYDHKPTTVFFEPQELETLQQTVQHQLSILGKQTFVVVREGGYKVIELNLGQI